MCSSMPVQPSVTNVPQYSMHSTYWPENELQQDSKQIQNRSMGFFQVF